MTSPPQPVAPAIFTLNPNHPDVALATLSRYILAAFNDLSSSSVSMDDLRIVVASLSQLSNDYIAALQASLADRQQLNARVVALEARSLSGTTGQLTKSLTVGVGGSTTTFGITYAKPMPSADHIVFVTLDNASASLLGTVSPVLPVTNKTAFGCTVTVRNTAAVTLASSVTVYVAALQLA